MAVVEVKIEGVDKVLDNLAKLSSQVQRREARRATRRGAAVLRDAARENARRLDDPKTPRSIAANIAIQESRRAGKAAGGVVMRVGVRGGSRKGASGSGTVKRYDTYYWRFLEFGTRYVRARPFMRPVLAQKAQAATDAVAVEFSAAFDRLLP